MFANHGGIRALLAVHAAMAFFTSAVGEAVPTFVELSKRWTSTTVLSTSTDDGRAAEEAAEEMGTANAPRTYSTQYDERNATKHAALRAFHSKWVSPDFCFMHGLSGGAWALRAFQQRGAFIQPTEVEAELDQMLSSLLGQQATACVGQN